jgi:hypothetical protein
MNTTHNLKKKLVVSAIGAGAAVAAPAVLFLGAGSAQANPNVWYDNNLFGTVANIADPVNPAGATELCEYHSNGIAPTPPIPFDAPVELDGATPSQIQIPGIQTGSHWFVRVSCNVGGTTTFNHTY